MHWIPLAEFAYNNSNHATTGFTPLLAEKGLHSSIEATVGSIWADGSILDVLDVKVQAEKLVEL